LFYLSTLLALFFWQGGPVREQNATAELMMTAYITTFLLVAVLHYFYFATCLYLLAEKVNIANSLWAFVPVLNLYILCQVAEKPFWWTILLFLPGINLIALTFTVISITRRFHKPTWLAALLFVPLANIYAVGYVTFYD
jgi:Family of unknown function (DUF5684)